MSTVVLSATEQEKILTLREGHFIDLKAKEIAPGKLTRSIAAFSNAEGGELYIGIREDKIRGTRHWEGFVSEEEANGHIQPFETLFPLGEGYDYTFLQGPDHAGLVLRADVKKSRDVKTGSDGKVYVRRGAANLPCTTDESFTRLRRNKGLSSFETETLAADPALLSNSTVILEFMLEVVPTAEPDPWLKKQQVIVGEKPTVAGIILFAEEPQAILPKRSGIKIYRYKTSAQEGTRDTLSGDPLSVEGHAYKQISESVRITSEIIESVRSTRLRD